MKTSYLFRSRKTRRRGSIASQSYAQLEPRQLLASFTINTVLDDGGATNDGLISLREAVMAANTNAPFGDAPAGDASGDFITFDSSLTGQTIEILQGSIPITEGLAIRGSGLDITIDADESNWIFDVNTDQQVIFNGLDFFGSNLTNGQGVGGGGIQMTGGGILRVIDSTFFGMGTYSEKRALTVQDSSLFIVRSSFSSNYTHSGAAIRVDHGVSRILDSTFTSNVAESTGGAIYINGGEHYIVNSEFNNNLASEPIGYGGERGGAVRITGQTKVDIFGSRFTNNSAGRGGAIYSSGDLSIWNDSLFRSNSATGSNDQTNDNADGGAIFSNGQLRMVDSTLEANVAQRGAGVYLDRDSVSLFNRAEIVGNDASWSGGGIYQTSGNSRLIDTTIEGNEAGGSVIVDDGFTLSRQFLGDGGGIYFDSLRPNSVLEIIGGKVSGNTAEIHGGGLFAKALNKEYKAYVRIHNGTEVSGNQTNRIHDPEDSQLPAGGGIYSGATLLQINDATITGNYSTGDGGGIHVQTGTTRLGDSTITANQAAWDGGGMNIVGGQVRLFQSTIGGPDVEDGNRAGQFVADGTRGFGGGVNLANQNGGSRFFMIGGMVANNIAKIQGGGISASYRNNVIRLQNQVAVSMNQALAEDGGGIYNDGAHLEIRIADISENVARNGGGIYQESGSLNLLDSTIQSNEARRTGGGLFFEGTFYRVSSIISDNLARFFPNIFERNG